MKKKRMPRKPKNTQYNTDYKLYLMHHKTENDAIGYEQTGYGEKSKFYAVTPSRARKLADWLNRAADYVEYMNEQN